MSRLSRLDFVDSERSLDERAAKKIRQQWLFRHMLQCHGEFIDNRSASVFVGTYNVNAKVLDGSLQDWLNPPETANTSSPDVYAIGFQEIVDLNAMNVALDGSKTVSRSQLWMDKIQESLGQCRGSGGNAEKYTLVAHRHLVGVLLCVYVKDSLVNAGEVRDVRTASTSVGVLGMGNKGGVSVRLHIYDTSMCFVCSHLAAHRENIEGRNADYRSIVEQSIFKADSKFRSNGSGQSGWVEKPSNGYLRTLGSDLRILDHDCVFWLGDLNYRIDGRLSTQQVFQTISEYSELAASAKNLQDGDALKRLQTLAEYDQLNIEREKPNGPFGGFAEGPLHFKPTYKYEPGKSDTYDTRNPKKIRAPAWCDRVLWRHASDMSRVCLLAYNCANLLPSDHKPVYCVVSLDCEKVQPDREKLVYDRLSNMLERYRYGGAIDGEIDQGITRRGCSFFPKLSLSADLLQFSQCTFLSTASQEITLSNIGAVFSAWRFVSKASSSSSDSNNQVLDEDGESICRRWLSITPTSGLLLPGESVTITVRVMIDALTAQRMNSGRGSLNDELVLRNENGNEHYICVTASYLRSCYGMSLEELTKTHEPVRATLDEVCDGCLPIGRSPRIASATVSDVPHASAGSVELAHEMDLLGLEIPIKDISPSFSSSAGVPPISLAAPQMVPPTVEPEVTASALKIISSQRSLCGPLASPPAHEMSIPKELWRLIQILKEPDTLKTPLLFEYYMGFAGDGGFADPIELAIIREALSTGRQIPAGSASAQGVVVALGQFLHALPRPVVPFWLWPESSLVSSSSKSDTTGDDGEDRSIVLGTPQMRSYCRKLMQQLPLTHYNTFVFVISFLRLVLIHAASNGTSPARLTAFCDSCMTGYAVDERKRGAIREVFEYLITARDIY